MIPLTLNVFVLFAVMDMALCLNWIFLGSLRLIFYYTEADYYIDEDEVNAELYDTSLAQDTYRM